MLFGMLHIVAIIDEKEGKKPILTLFDNKNRKRCQRLAWLPFEWITFPNRLSIILKFFFLICFVEYYAIIPGVHVQALQVFDHERVT